MSVAAPQPVQLDHTSYPHIMAAILSHAECDVLHAFRATSRVYLSLVEALLAPRQTIVHVRRGTLHGPLEAGVPILRDSQLASFLRTEAPHLRQRLTRIRALELHDATGITPLLPLLPHAIVRIRATGLRERVQTLAAFLYLDTQHNIVPLPPAARLVVNTHASSGARVSTLLEALPKTRAGLPKELVLNFGAWETPPWLGSGLGRDRSARMMSVRESALLLRYVRWAAGECAVTLVEFARVWAWAQPVEGFGAGTTSAEREVGALFAHQEGKRLHVLSLEEYRLHVGDAFEVEAGWSI
jgi:hypothetical protein